jgi:hypothetical protein
VKKCFAFARHGQWREAENFGVPHPNRRNLAKLELVRLCLFSFLSKSFPWTAHYAVHFGLAAD